MPGRPFAIGNKLGQHGRTPLTPEQREARALLNASAVLVMRRLLDVALGDDPKLAVPVLLRLLDKIAPDLLDAAALAGASPFRELTVAQLVALASPAPPDDG